MVRIGVHSKYYRKQIDDCLAGGTVDYKGKVYYWSAQNSNYGFGWEIEPVTEDDWDDIPEDDSDEIAALIGRCLNEHRTRYVY